MALSKAFEAFAVDLFSSLESPDFGPIRVKRMFGGALAYAGDHGFALLDDEAIWIKVDAQSEAAFQAQGCPRFTYPMKDGRMMDMAYRRMPEAALDDAEEACRWARLGIDAAMRKAKAKRPKKVKA
jgi:DNA transformation protein